MNFESIENYAYNLPVIIQLIQSSNDIVKHCINPAFNDAINQKAGNFWGVRKFENEVSSAKNLMEECFVDYFNGAIVHSKEEFDIWHRRLCDRLICCFPEYNLYMEKSGLSRSVGFNYGNAQKFINMLFKDIFAISVVKNNKSFNSQQFMHCHMPLDSYTLEFYKREVGANKRTNITTAFKNGWSSLVDYDLYLSMQNDIRTYIYNKYSGKESVLESEFEIWENYKPLPKASINNQSTNKNLNYGEKGEQIVLAELEKRGYSATRTAKNAVDIDIIATSPSGTKINIQVKTKSPTNKSNEFVLGSGKRMYNLVNRNVWFIFVDLSTENTNMYIEHALPVFEKASLRKDAWDKGFNKKTGLPHKPDPVYYYRYSELKDDAGNCKVNNWNDLP